LLDEDVWQNPDLAKKLGRNKSHCENVIDSVDSIAYVLDDLAELLAIAVNENDTDAIDDIINDLFLCDEKINNLEFRRMFSGKLDANSCFLDIQAGSGGTEAQDWAEMLMRMYMRWAEQHNFVVKVIEQSAGEVAGLKSATLHIIGDYAFGWLRPEIGVHRLVRKSPFDSGARRHTSFASVFISPEIDDDIAVSLNPSELRIDTYRSSGAGGQHVNTTDSAVRITHVPTGIVVQCQSDRSQHKNKAHALKQLQSKLYQHELSLRQAGQQALESNKSDISWGSQIRSYVLDASRIKDLRTGIETSDTQKVLDGDIDVFLEAGLKQGLGLIEEMK
jgi:peptide chain release factor 2